MKLEFDMNALTDFRKLQKATWRDGQIRRRSPRISALDANQFGEEDVRGRGRGRGRDEEQRTIRTNKIKRRFDDAAGAGAGAGAEALKSTSKLAKQVWKVGRDVPQNEEHSAKYMDWRYGHESQENHKSNNSANKDGKASIIPAKHILELVLDTLQSFRIYRRAFLNQKRDTYEIFAEPVDPDEVEEYYEIIREPMDFGTMRAKLHEGMYQNLEQFEHDVYLIPENAMHFNSSTTVYFRQARAIHDLAKKVFDALKTDPDNFVSEFSSTRRRSMRKALSDTKDSNISFLKSSTTKTNYVSFKGTPPSPLGSSIFRRTSKKNPGCTGMTDHFGSRNFFTEKRNGRLTSSEVEDMRSTWRSPSYNENDDFGSTFYSSSKPLMMMNEGDIRYEDSLLSFVKDLGPIAQMVAKRKLSVGGQHGSKCNQINVDVAAVKTNNNNNNNNNNTFRTFRDFADGRHPSFLKANSNNIIIDLTEDGEAANGIINKKVKVKYSSSDPGGKEKTVCGGKEKIDPPPPPLTLTTPGHADDKQDGFTKTRKMRRGGSCSSNLGKPGDDDNVGRPVILALENTHSIHVAEFKSRNKKGSPLTTVPPPLKSQSQSQSQNQNQNQNQSQDSHSRPPPPPPPPTLQSGGEKEGAQPMPSVSRFTFDLPFLKARLGLMGRAGCHAGGGDCELNGGGGKLDRSVMCMDQVESIGIVKRPFLYNHQSSLSRRPPLPFDKMDTKRKGGGMAYRRKQGMGRSSTFKEETFYRPPPEEPSSLAAQAIRASANNKGSSPTYDYTSMESSNEGGSFWGVVARKAKAILDDDNNNNNNNNNVVPCQSESELFYHSSRASDQVEISKKMDNPTLRKGLDAFTSSMNRIGNAFEEGRTIVESKTADLIQETRKLQMRRKCINSEEQNLVSSGQSKNLTSQEDQLKASRDVAMATAAKAKLLLRELKTVKADLAFAKQRSSQLEEENKILREGREKGVNHADDDMIRLQLETLLAEKARLAHENSVYARENRFLREIVEYHQLTMQDVVYLDEGMEEFTEVYPTTAVSRTLSVSPPSPMSPRSPSQISLPRSSSSSSIRKEMLPPSPKDRG
ncbi:hypothetical protein ACJIZ3_022243 [Penstemon smallii]|uniref:Bromo domain-containing protein n=1 Tax=Penstemon smallii TaxID=265156 RepID=A0ABD3SNS2_9LAMI